MRKYIYLKIYVNSNRRKYLIYDIRSIYTVFFDSGYKIEMVKGNNY